MNTFIFKKVVLLTLLLPFCFTGINGQEPRPGIECGCKKYDNYVEPGGKLPTVKNEDRVTGNGKMLSLGEPGFRLKKRRMLMNAENICMQVFPDSPGRKAFFFSEIWNTIT